MLKGPSLGKGPTIGTHTIHASGVTSAQSLIQGHLAETQSKTAAIPEEVVTSNNPTKTTSETQHETRSETPVKAKDWGGAQPKTRQHTKAMVRGHMSVFELFLECISETLHTKGIYI